MLIGVGGSTGVAGPGKCADKPPGSRLDRSRSSLWICRAEQPAPEDGVSTPPHPAHLVSPPSIPISTRTKDHRPITVTTSSTSPRCNYMAKRHGDVDDHAGHRTRIPVDGGIPQQSPLPKGRSVHTSSPPNCTPRLHVHTRVRAPPRPVTSTADHGTPHRAGCVRRYSDEDR